MKKILLVFLCLPILLLSIGCATDTKPYKETVFALDTVIDLTVIGPDAEKAAKAAIVEMKRLESLLSSYKPDSEISTINRLAGKEPVSISPETEAVLQLSLRYARATGGAFDPTIGPVVELWGIGKKGSFVPDDQTITAALKFVDYRLLEIDPQQHKARLVKPGMKLDLGGVAKGFIIDRMTDILKKYGIRSALINGGGDVRVIGLKPDGTPWRIGVQSPRKPDALAARIPMTGWQIVETSGDYQRFIEVDGRRYHHIFDPKTGKPSAGLVSATLVMPEGIEDLPSNILLIIGPDRSRELLKKFPGIEAIFIEENGTVSFTPGLNGKIEVEK